MGTACGRVISIFAVIGLVVCAAGLFASFYYKYDVEVNVSQILGTSFYVNVNVTYKAIWWHWDAMKSLDDFYRDDTHRRDGQWFLTINGDPIKFVRANEKVLIGSGNSWNSKLQYLYNPLSG